MRKLQMNLLAAPSFGTPIWMPLACLVLVALIVHATWSGLTDRWALAALEIEQDQAFATDLTATSHQGSSESTPGLELVSASIAQINRSWLERLASLQDAKIRGVHLVRMDSSQQGVQAMLVGRSAEALSLMTFVNKLRSLDTVVDAKLMSQSPFISRPGDRYGATPPALEFSVALTWRDQR